MGTHQDFHITAVVHRWKHRAKKAEATLARIQEVIDQHEQDDLKHPRGTTGRSAAYTTIRSIMKEPTPPNYR